MDQLLIDLPTAVYVDDYHEFHSIEKLLRALTGKKKVKVTETGLFHMPTRQYVGIVHYRKDKDYKRLLKELEEQSDWPKGERPTIGIITPP